MKKVILLSVATAVSLVLQCQIAAAGSYRNTPFDGFYLGAGGTWEQYDTEIELFGVDIDDALGNPLDTSGIEAGRVYLGFGLQNGALYGGLEAFGSFTGAEINFPFDTDDYPGEFDPAMGGPSDLFVRANYSFGGSARVGVFMTPRSMLFVKRTATTTSFDAGIEGSILNGTAFQGTEIAIKENVTAFGFGGGVEFAVSNHLFVRADYDQLWYADFEIDIPDFRLEPSYRAVTLSVGYRF